MHTALQRLFVLSVITGGGYAAWSWWQRQDTGELGAAPEWPPLDAANGQRTGRPGPTGGSTTTAAAETAAVPTAAANGRWVEPIDGACPDGYPVKANDKSGIYHLPGGRFYERTVPERCYAGAEHAEADGYRAAKA